MQYRDLIRADEDGVTTVTLVCPLSRHHATAPATSSWPRPRPRASGATPINPIDPELVALSTWQVTYPAASPGRSGTSTAAAQPSRLFSIHAS